MNALRLLISMIILFIGTTVMAQNTTPAPKWVTEATTVKKERALKDLNLSESNASKLYDLCIQNSMETIAKMKTAASEEEKKAVRFEDSKKLKQSIIEAFPGELGAQIASWNAEYWGKYLKK